MQGSATQQADEVHTAGASASAPGGAIPNIIHFTGPWEPLDVVRQNREMVAKGSEFRYYNNSQLVQSVNEISLDLEKAGVHGAADAFHELRPWAYRSDLWRYMILWQSGGVYLDAKLQLTAPLSTWVDQANGTLAACHDLDPPDNFWNAMLAARRRDPTLLATIRQIVWNVQARYYPEDVPGRWHRDLNITGPGLLTSVLKREHVAHPPARCRLSETGHEVLSIETGIVLAQVNVSVHDAMRSCTNCHKYGELFRLHQVYCSEPGPSCELSLLTLPHADAEPYWSYVV